MTDMIERVARAIMRAREGVAYQGSRGVIAEAADNPHCALAVRQARDALQAMREPTPGMLHAAARAMSPGRRPTPERVSCKQKHRIRYRAMVDAALNIDAALSGSLSADGGEGE